ncbi:DUF2567 domain-containing protein [Mycobacterium haemophilum]|uniref:Membrane protein n=1 Tax=Mycobacterium haemophilum TaxID=29311 RepID=A0A0I9U8K0_9MYCO|nr:DUF2567 domain-containing protein [Mycobacterium haemophilum]KLO32822.1 membrane protein [Mycobacterium haemophilum]KLO37125.1 membrane protein [Mycobacterium haemophilum]KLO43597.1 membrane protein [Mycobacterium haemophilum]KLO55956.1 membrane protein [Mycobacterium haemophilum]
MTDHCAPGVSDVSCPPLGRVMVGVVLGLAVTGVLIGGLWAWIAPPIHAVVALTRTGERVHDYLGNESEHFFVAPCLMLGLLTVVAVMVSVLAWQWREHRGPGMVIGLAIGLMTCAATATAVGALLVWMRYGAVNFDAVSLSDDHKVAHVIQAPPVFFAHGPLQVAATVLWPAGIAALVYAVLAAANGRDDLGGQPVVDKSSKALPMEPEASVP